MKNFKSDLLILTVIAAMLGIGFVNHYTHVQRIEALEQEYDELRGNYNLLDYGVLELEKESDLTNDSISVLKAELSDYINKHQFSHDLEVVLTRAELYLMVEEIMIKLNESED